MHDLQLVGVHDDGEHLVLSDTGGQRYLLPVDEALRAAVRRDRAHLGQAQNEANGRLRPRDVQARVRAGMDAESIAQAAGWPVEKVRRFEGPVLAERAHMAQLAREVRLRRRAGEPVTLDAEVTHRLVDRGVDPDLATWDSWRGDDGPWTVAVEFTAGGRDRRATWQFDVVARSVVPADDEARWLSEQSHGGTDGPLSAARPTTIEAGSVYDIDADGGVTAAGSPRPGKGNAADGTGGRDPVDLMSAMRSRRRDRENPVRPNDRGTVRDGIDPTDVPGPTHPARRTRPPAADTRDESPSGSRPTPAIPTGLIRKPDLASTKPTSVKPSPAAAKPSPAAPSPTVDIREGKPPSAEPSDVSTASESPQAAETEPAERSAARPAKPRPRRASVPSWDDIMFGAKRD